MNDLAKLSNDQLLAMYQQGKSQRDRGFVAGPTAAPDKIAQRQEYGSATKSLAADRERIRAYAPTIQSLDRFGQLNEKTGTAPFFARMAEPFNPDLQEMNSIASALQVTSVPKGQGQVSNFERDLFARGTPGLNKVGNVNANIRGHMKATYEQENDRLDFMEQFLNRNGTLNGAQSAWGKYVSDNPYTKQVKLKSGENRIDVNKNRQAWRQYFGLEASDPRQQAAQKLRGQAPVKQAAPQGQVTIDIFGRPVR